MEGQEVIIILSMLDLPMLETSPVIYTQENIMKFNVPDMSCGHCKATIETAIKSVDETAKIEIDLASKTVDITSAVNAGDFAAALESSGYPSTALAG